MNGRNQKKVDEIFDKFEINILYQDSTNRLLMLEKTNNSKSHVSHMLENFKTVYFLAIVISVMFYTDYTDMFV